ncbi:MAG: amidohydrolase [Planctomycetota bacterium]|nr:amidohydrolase [Planctomycetota bacterium]
MNDSLSPTAEEQAELVATRRDIHAHPELKYEEQRTSGLVAERLSGLGYSCQTGVGRTGVVTVLEGEADGPCVLLRADMDALPLQEKNEVAYASKTPGVMHACGHDGHTAMGLTAARILRRLGRPARGRIKFMFQPAEEGGNGAVAMIEDGVLENPKVDAAFGIHLWSPLEVGKVSIVDGPFMASVDEFTVRVLGTGGHGAMPHQTRDPVLAAAHIVTALQQIAARNVSPLQAVVVTVGAIHGGEAFNIVPDEVVLRGTARSFDEDVWKALPDHLERVVTHTALAFGCKAELQIQRMMRPTINDPAMAELVREVAREVVGPENIISEGTMGGEDFAEVLAVVPGCYFFVGARNEATGKIHPHHSPYFDIDEDALSIGARLLVGVAQRYLAHGA